MTYHKVCHSFPEVIQLLILSTFHIQSELCAQGLSGFCYWFTQHLHLLPSPLVLYHTHQMRELYLRFTWFFQWAFTIIHNPWTCCDPFYQTAIWKYWKVLSSFKTLLQDLGRIATLFGRACGDCNVTAHFSLFPINYTLLKDKNYICLCSWAHNRHSVNLTREMSQQMNKWIWTYKTLRSL